ncbi:hypothetical protein Rs2_47720 [Raphanus sativus]|uniref:Paired amphipathic helix protein Sin3-like 2 n=1 Tax=Raphanus sativus TaxID=3726 RepID=A0A6J0JKI5_RAPSA|nr:paired amphipathic helix protein Sin3-like 2 [Raphanus sativus]KAJ4870673.1 hypothetical protein Rs2_47720 [Raphanus sativus]
MASVDENLESLLSSAKEIYDKLSDSEMKSLLSLIHAFSNKEITVSVLSKSTHLLFGYHKNTTEQQRHSGMESLLSLIDALSNKGITHSVFSKSIDVLFDNHVKTTKQDFVEEGEIREDYHACAVRADVDESPEKSGAHVRIRVKIDENPKEDVSEEKKRRILQSEEKKPKKSRRLDRVTPSYKLIPEEQQYPVSDNLDDPELDCLNNKYSVMQFNGASGHKQLSKYEEAIERCEEDMFETDMLMGSLESAVKSAEKVLEEEMGVEQLGMKFYRCIEMLYRGDMSEIVREDHKKALPVILIRLKQKLDELTGARESWKPRWKKVFKENTAKQREATRKKMKGNSFC